MGVEGARRRVQRLMKDRCRITQDPLRLSDAVLNEETLELEPNAENDSLIYQGICFISKKSGGRSIDSETGMALSSDEYFVGIPWGTKTLRKGMILDVIQAEDPALKNQRFTLTKIDMGTIQVWRTSDMAFLETDRD